MNNNLKCGGTSFGKFQYGLNFQVSKLLQQTTTKILNTKRKVKIENLFFLLFKVLPCKCNLTFIYFVF